MYKIYNRLFEHLKRIKNKFSRKKVSGKQNLKNELKATHAKLQKYYEQIHDELRLLYEKAILLHFIVDDTIFNSFDGKREFGQKFGRNVYGETLTNTYQKYKQHTFIMTTTHRSHFDEDFRTMNEIFDENNLHQNIEKNEFQKYKRQNIKFSQFFFVFILIFVIIFKVFLQFFNIRIKFFFFFSSSY